MRRGAGWGGGGGGVIKEETMLEAVLTFDRIIVVRPLETLDARLQSLVVTDD